MSRGEETNHRFDNIAEPGASLGVIQSPNPRSFKVNVKLHKEGLREWVFGFHRIESRYDKLQGGVDCRVIGARFKVLHEYSR
jgi:hypothetical protein